MKKILLIIGSVLLIMGIISLIFTGDETQKVFVNQKVQDIKKPMLQQEPRKTILKPFQEEPKKPIIHPNEDNPEPKEVYLSLESMLDPQNYHWPNDKPSAGDVYLDGGKPVHVDIDTFLSLRKGDTLTLILDNYVFVGTVIEYRTTDPNEGTGSLISIKLEESGEIGRFGEPSLLLRYYKYNPESVNKDIGWISSGSLYVRYPGRRYNLKIFENRGLLMTEREYNQSWSEKRALPQ